MSSGLTALELSYILAVRGHDVPSGVTKQVLCDMVGALDPGELRELQHWESMAAASTPEEWSESNGALPAVGALAKSLALLTGHECRLSLPLLSQCRSRGPDFPVRGLLAYYMRMGLSPSPRPRVFTPEQDAVAEIALTPPGHVPRRTLVTAGPGTGKTTVVVEYTRRCVEAGGRVLVVAYTNSAVQTIYNRMLGEPGLVGRVAKKAFGAKKTGRQRQQPVMLSTVDLLAQRVLLGGADRAVRQMNGAFDEVVREALVVVRHSAVGATAGFMENDVPMFDHVVIDEAQMLSKDRAALVLGVVDALTFGPQSLNGARSCHLTVFGDPRQTISPNTGEWLYPLVGRGTRVEHDGRTWDVGALSTTFRFTSSAMLEYVMAISRRRPELHVELQRPLGSLDLTPESPISAISGGNIAEVAALVARRYGESGSVGVLSPTLGRSNRTSVQVGALLLLLRRMGVPVSQQGQGNYHPGGVTVSTFHSSAGMEFAHVFLLGISGFPRHYPGISQEVGRSLVFVANSRAARTVTLVLDSPELCADVDPGGFPNSVYNQPVESYAVPEELTPRLPDAWSPEWMFSGQGDGPGARFLDTNEFVPGACVRADKRNHAARCPMYEAQLAWGRPPVLCDAAQAGGRAMSPAAAHARGLASAGRVLQDLQHRRLCVGESPICLAGPPNGWGEREAFYWYMNHREEPPLGESQVKAPALLKELADGVIQDYCGAAPRYATILPLAQRDRAGEVFYAVPDYQFNCGGRTGFVVFTSEVLRALYTAVVPWLGGKGEAPLLLQVVPDEGRVVLYDGFHAAMGYLVPSLRRLHEYAITRAFQAEFLKIPPGQRPPPNTFAVDTEFINGSTIYEVGLLNMGDPYRSVCALVGCPELTQQELTRLGFSRQEFNATAVSIDAVLSRLILRASADAPAFKTRLYYYLAPVDVKWATERFNVIGAVDVAAVAAPYLTRRGRFETDSSAADLDSLYSTYVGPVLGGGRHRAFVDAVMLGEILQGIVQQEALEWP